MTEHAGEIITLMIWALLAGGGLFLALLKWIAGRVIDKLSQIEAAIDRTNVTLAGIEKDLRKDLSQLDRRVQKIEDRCQMQHDHHHKD